MGFDTLMKVTVEKQQEAPVAVISLEIDAEQAAVEYGKACKRLSQRINVPGFRRGKIPRPVIEKNVGIDRIKQEALERFLPHVFADVISENQLDIVAPPSVDNYTFDLAEGISIKASVELRPEVTLPDLANLTLDVEKFASPEGALDKELDALVKRYTTLEPVVDRPSADNDIVVIDFTGSMQGELIRGGAAKNYRLDLETKTFIPGFEAQLVNRRIGEEFTIQVTFPTDYAEASLAGKPADFFIRMNDVQKKVVPELNDELARKVGDYPTIEVLRNRITSLLQQSEERENNARKQAALVSKLLEMVNIDVPDGMTNREARLLQDEVKERLKAQNIAWEQYVESQGAETVWKNLRDEAARRIKTSLIIGAIATQEQLMVTDQEFAEGVQELANERGINDKMLMKQLANNNDSLRLMNDMLLSQKVIDTVMGRCTVQWKDPVANAPVVKDDVAKAIEGEVFDVLTQE
jgi:trigger factor